ncbi:DUF1616 domain-containing protein (plasmid) [Haloferacaceae archaeon DSL9]
MKYSESNQSVWQRLVNAQVVPWDILGVFAYVGIAYALLAAYPASPFRVLVAIPLVFFLPGYAVVGILYPQSGVSIDVDRGLFARGREADRITLVERVAFAFALSIVIVPVIGLALTLSPWPAIEQNVVTSLVFFIVGGSVLAAARWYLTPSPERFFVPVRHWSGELRDTVFRGSRIDRVLNIAVILSILVAMTAVGYAFAVPQQGEQYTDFYLLTENDNGDLVAGDYPDQLVAGEEQSLTVGIDNREGETVDYTIVVTAEQVENQGGESQSVEEVELTRMQTTVGADATWTNQHVLAPELVGDNVRINYYLFEGDAAPNPNPENAEEHLYIWTSIVTEADVADDEPAGGEGNASDDGAGGDGAAGNETTGNETADNETAGDGAAGDNATGNDTTGDDPTEDGAATDDGAAADDGSTDNGTEDGAIGEDNGTTDDGDATDDGDTTGGAEAGDDTSADDGESADDEPAGDGVGTDGGDDVGDDTDAGQDDAGTNDSGADEEDAGVGGAGAGGGETSADDDGGSNTGSADGSSVDDEQSGTETDGADTAGETGQP